MVGVSATFQVVVARCSVCYTVRKVKKPERSVCYTVRKVKKPERSMCYTVRKVKKPERSVCYTVRKVKIRGQKSEKTRA
jgi:hypothetical protein